MNINMKSLLVTGAMLCMTASLAMANVPYQQGFESDTSGWTVSGGITRVASGGGTLGLAAASGDYYAEVTNLRDDYQPGCGTGGYSFYGGKVSTYTKPFYQSIDVYINKDWAAVPMGGNPAVWIDMTPNHLDPANYGAEQNFQLWVDGDNQVEISATGRADRFVTITSSGWYTFEMVFRPGTNVNNYVETDMNVYDSSHSLLGTTTLEAISPGGPFYNSDLTGNGYVWLSVWQNGFAGDTLAIDNLATGYVPEPATLSLLALGAIGLIRRKK